MGTNGPLTLPGDVRRGGLASPAGARPGSGVTDGRLAPVSRLRDTTTLSIATGPRRGARLLGAAVLLGKGRRQHAFDAGLDLLTLGAQALIPAFEKPTTNRLAQFDRHRPEFLANLLDLLLLGVFRDFDDLDGLAKRPVGKPHARRHPIPQGDPAFPKVLPVGAEHGGEELDQVLPVAHGLSGEFGEAQRSATGVPAGVVTGGKGAARRQFRRRSVREFAVLVGHHQLTVHNDRRRVDVSRVL
jgi:hypothetical protein